MREFDVIVIGSGPAGYVAAIRAGQLGMKTAVVEKDKLGGMCLNWGCIPSKTLIESAKLYDRLRKAESFGIEGIDQKAVYFNWKKALSRKNRLVTRLVKGVEYLMKKNRVEVIAGEARLAGSGRVAVGDDTYAAKNVLVATGSSPTNERLEALDPTNVMEIGALFDANEIPDKFLVFGSSPYACETAFMLRLIGKKVALAAPERMLMPRLDSELSEFVLNMFDRNEMTVYMGREITKQGVGGVYLGDDFVECDTVINCSERAAVLPVTEGAELKLRDGFISVNEYLQSSLPSVYAAGDVTGQITAHTGSAQGITAANHMADIKEKIDYRMLPENVYLAPEIASVGLSESELKDSGQDYSKGVFPLAVNGKAMAEGNTDGFVKVLAEKKYGEVLGVHIVAANATDMIAEAVAIMRLEGTLEDVGRIVHAHPTVSESIVEASLAASGMPRHI
jgi:dihydrolipoamide dehydrogenase